MNDSEFGLDVEDYLVGECCKISFYIYDCKPDGLYGHTRFCNQLEGHKISALKIFHGFITLYEQTPT